MFDWDSYSKRIKEAEDRVEAKDAAARAAGTLVGRCYRESVADGYALYEITRVTARTVTLKHIKIGDGYMSALLGGGGTFPRHRIEAIIKANDKFRDLCARARRAA